MTTWICSTVGIAVFSLTAMTVSSAAPPPQRGAPAPATAQHAFCGCNFPGSNTWSFNSPPPSDCAYASNTAGVAYDPTFVMRIPVVWHVVHRTNGTGDVMDQVIIAQMAKLNDDFRPPVGSMGNDSGIEFYLATQDPSGMPTTGIEHVANNTWFGDNGNYANQLAWDTNRYLNVYTMDLGGAIGYVPDLPQGGIVGSNNDGVRMLYTAINSAQFNHVLSHEIGHHLGLYHTFGLASSCQNSNCQTQGDLICDTNPHRNPTNTCSGNPGNCGGQQVPRHNYMNYQDVNCVYEFTAGQIQRMRCTLEHWRPETWDTPGIGSAYCTVVQNSTGLPGALSADGSSDASQNDVTLSAMNLPTSSFGFFLVSQTQGFVQNPGGSAGNLCLGGSIGRFVGPGQIQQSNAQGAFDLVLDLAMTPTPMGFVGVQPGEAWNYQAWFRDSVMGTPTSNMTNGLEITYQ